MPVTKILIANRGDDAPSAGEQSEAAGAKRSGTGPRGLESSSIQKRG